MQVHACDARAAHRPAGEDGLRARGVVLRARAPAPGADGATSTAPTATGGWSTCAPRIVLDGGAYASSTTAVVANAATFALRALRRAERAHRRATSPTPTTRRAARCAASARCRSPSRHESQMDRLAAALGMDPVELRLRNALATGIALPTGQVVDGPAPVRELLERLRDMPLPPPTRVAGRPARAARRRRPTPPTARASARGVGYAVGFKNIALLRGLRRLLDRARAPLASTATGRWSRCTPPPPRSARGSSRCRSRSPAPSSASSACVVLPADTQVGSAGSTSASRQTYMTGGAVQAARCAPPSRERAGASGALDSATGRSRRRAVVPAPPDRRRSTRSTGQGDAHVAFAFAAHRAVVDVDVELGLVRVVEIATHPGRRPGDEPARARGADRGRHRAGPRAGPDGGDPGRRRPGAQRRRSPTT